MESLTVRKLVSHGLLCASAWLVSPAYAAVTDENVAQCAGIENSIQRLSCYDDLAESNNLSKKTVVTTPAGNGKWSTSTDTDPLTDKSVYFAILPADTGKGRLGEQINLIVKCANGTTDMYISWHSFLGTDSALITHRVGKEKAVRQAWSLSTDHLASFYPGSPVAILKKMVNTNSFVANVTPYNESPVTAIFDTSGIGEALSDVRKGCSW
jgi:type VI secretion system protein VasI